LKAGRVSREKITFFLAIFQKKNSFFIEKRYGYTKEARAKSSHQRGSFLVQLPCPLGRGFRNANYLFLRALALFFCFSKKSLKGLKPSQITLYLL